MISNPLNTVLVANRGEIALRIMRTARSMGLETVAVYSDADQNAPHVAFADKSIHIGPAPASESYLSIAAIMLAAEMSGTTAIHPGYGFLSENADFARTVEDAGLLFIGPSAAAIEAMGDKARAKRAMIAAGVPCIPGYEGEDQSLTQFLATANEIGYPLMVKAAAGGGGRGMRLVEQPAELETAINLARSEAESAFGSGGLILEKAIFRPRHVEVQVFADKHGNTIHLGERDCSVQRRNQKVLEEAPCPIMTPDLREAMGNAAVEAARAVDYLGAGTVEFLLDEDGKFYFLEMNTRLQVEHPVTECVTGLDLVELQFRIAVGETLPLKQDQVQLAGHAIEARVYAEDPERDFLPSAGGIVRWSEPKGDGIRVDAGIETRGEISSFYDAMVAKIIAHGRTREESRQRLATALTNTVLFGPKTNLAFLADAIERPDFVEGLATTAFIQEVYGTEGFKRSKPNPHDLIAASIAEHLNGQAKAQQEALNVPNELLDWSSTSPRPSVALLETGATTTKLTVTPAQRGQYVVAGPNDSWAVTVDKFDDNQLVIHIDGVPTTYRYYREHDGVIFLQQGATTHQLSNLVRRSPNAQIDAGGGLVTAPMHGKLIDIIVSPGDFVSAGTRLAILEAMKMQHEIVAEIDGTISEVFLEAGAQIAADDVILEIAPAEGSK